jgi:16S rRNA (cytosine967-C5)-methyltransferase
VSAIDRSTLPEKLRHNLPDWLATRLARTAARRLLAAGAGDGEAAPLDLRVNTVKAKRDDIQRALADAGIVAVPTPHSPWGLRVQGKPALNKMDVFTGGSVEVQDEGSQLLALLTDAKRGEMVVDFCAGAGGKTLALGAAMRNTGRLYAFDVSGHRLDALKPRLARSGLSNVYPAQIAHERDDRVRRLAGKIDRVLVDAPCSGLGTLRRNPDLKWRQSPQSVAELQAKQTGHPGQRIAPAQVRRPAGLRHLQPAGSREPAGGRGLRGRARARFRRLAGCRRAGRGPCGPGAGAGRRAIPALWPHRHQTDGFFAAVWQRR